MIPHLVLIVGTAETAAALRAAAVLPSLAARGRVTLLSGVDDRRLTASLGPAQWVLPLLSYPERRLLRALRRVVDRLPSFILRLLVGVERSAAIRLRSAWDRDEVAEVLDLLAPALMVNCSPVALPAADLPLRLARARGMRTAACILSGEDLLSRARLINLYDLYVVPDPVTRDRLLRALPGLPPSRVVGGEERTGSGARGDVPPAETAYRDLAAWWRDGGGEGAQPA